MTTVGEAASETRAEMAAAGLRILSLQHPPFLCPLPRPSTVPARIDTVATGMLILLTSMGQIGVALSVLGLELEGLTTEGGVISLEKVVEVLKQLWETGTQGAEESNHLTIE